MGDNVFIFSDNRRRRINNGLYLSHYDYSKMCLEFISDTTISKSLKIECDTATFSVHFLSPEKNEKIPRKFNKHRYRASEQSSLRKIFRHFSKCDGREKRPYSQEQGLS